MNERINKLLEQVQVNPQIERLAKQAGCSIDRLGYGEGNLEKFAELIVRECMDAVGNDPMAQPYLQQIKAKFGVEYYEPIEKAFGVEV